MFGVFRRRFVAPPRPQTRALITLSVVYGPTFYRGSAGWGTFYKGVKSDAQVYLGTRTLHP